MLKPYSLLIAAVFTAIFSGLITYQFLSASAPSEKEALDVVRLKGDAERPSSEKAVTASRADMISERASTDEPESETSPQQAESKRRAKPTSDQKSDAPPEHARKVEIKSDHEENRTPSEAASRPETANKRRPESAPEPRVTKPAPKSPLPLPVRRPALPGERAVREVAASSDDPARPETSRVRQPQSRTIARCTPYRETIPLPDLSRFSMRDKIGQMLIMGFRGTTASAKWPQAVARQIRRGEIGGVLFLKHNVGSAKSTKRLISSFKDIQALIPPLLMVDQEGGKVQRFGRRIGFEKIPSAQQVARRLSVEDAEDLYARTARKLKKWGINTNLGPVVDVNVYKNNPVIGRLGRSYSGDPATVSRYARAFVKAHRQHGMITALKHFPGHGSSRRDSHKGFTDISNSWQKPREMMPFKTLIRRGCTDMVMIGHLFLRQYQEKREGDDPATFSRRIIQNLLRDDLGYQGVVITDDLEMGAIRNQFSPMTAILRAMKAGNDLLIVSNSANPDVNLPRKILDFIEARAAEDPKLRQSISQSFARILRLKARLPWPDLQQSDQAARQ